MGKITIKFNTPFVYSIRGKYVRPLSEDTGGWYFRLNDGLYVLFYEHIEQLRYDLRRFQWVCSNDDIVYDEHLRMYAVKIEINRFGVYVHKMMRLFDFMRKIDESVDEGVAKQQE